jgi:UDP-N-acetyl-D-glucosamine/UDP-N-acetyl-D-galactosamine dehydrogenase
MDLKNSNIAIIGLGYVGLPLAVEFGKKYPTIGYDINLKRVDELKSGLDTTLECNESELAKAHLLSYTMSLERIAQCNIYIITVPTPIDKNKQPDLTALISSSKAVGSVLSKYDLVIYESTVYPGATEEICIPILERVSGLKYKKDFHAGYSPERINPGDKEHRLTNIIKVTSGSTIESAEIIDQLYKTIIQAGTHKASSIKVAEAAKVIENTQRDVNIALINELSIIFNKLEIDTLEVLQAAGTKWNFLPFRPGLVGGHCIGVDPYYLTHKAQAVGYYPEMILAGRRINDGMGKYVVSEMVKRMIKERIKLEGARVLIMGLTFKENCPDLRNTKVIDIINELKEFNIQVDIIDPLCSEHDAILKYDLNLISDYKEDYYDGIILAIGHDQFKEMGSNAIRKMGKSSHVLYDLKYVLDKNHVDIRL